MMNAPQRRHRELLDLAESTPWAQALACRLVGDAHLAEDLVQDAWLASLQRRPKMASPRAWLAGTIRRLSAGERRNRARRRIREETSARSEALPAASETVARLEAEEILVACLLSIDEPFRGALTARHVDGLSAREIATRDGVPLSTVNGRLDRGLKRLKAKLEHRHGGDAASWMSAMAPLIPAQVATPKALLTGTIAAKKTLITIAALMALTSLSWVLVEWSTMGSSAATELAVSPISPLPSELNQGSRTEVLTALPPRSGPERTSAATGPIEPLESMPEAHPKQDPTATVHGSPLEGRLIIRDTDGSNLMGMNGELVIHSLGQVAATKPIPLSFRGGSFSLNGLPAGRIQVKSAVATTSQGERPIALDAAEFEIPGGSPLLLHGRFLPTSTLRVVDALTGEDLANVGVLPMLPGHAGPEAAGPGPHRGSDFSVTRSPSPVRLPFAVNTQPYWVIANNYAWGFIQINHETGGERVIALEPAGSLAVQPVGPMEALGGNVFEIFIRIYDEATGAPVQSSRIGLGGSQGFSGVPEGASDVRVEVGLLEEERTLLGAARVDVTRGVKAQVKVEITGIPFPQSVHVQGTVLMPPGHGERNFSLSLRPAQGPVLLQRDVKSIERGAMTKLESSEALGWWADTLTPGTYRFLVEPFQYETLLEVPQSDVQGLEIVVPELFPVEVRITDSASREAVQNAVLRWSRGGPARTEHADPDPSKDGVILLHMPAGPATFTAMGPGRSEATMNYVIGSGLSQINLELPRAMARDRQ